ncbi:MAG: hypothetical protein ACE5HQ_14090, partial [Gemmatimonadota bacterium]
LDCFPVPESGLGSQPRRNKKIILDLPPTANGCPISERALRPLLALDDPEAQLDAIRELLGDFVPAEA